MCGHGTEALSDRVGAHVELIDSNGMLHGTEYTFEATEAALELIEETVECPTRAITMSRV